MILTQLLIYTIYNTRCGGNVVMQRFIRKALHSLTGAHEKKDLDRIQDEAARIVTGATKLVSLMLLHNDVCWDLLQE